MTSPFCCQSLRSTQTDACEGCKKPLLLSSSQSQDWRLFPAGRIEGCLSLAFLAGTGRAHICFLGFLSLTRPYFHTMSTSATKRPPSMRTELCLTRASTGVQHFSSTSVRMFLLFHDELMVSKGAKNEERMRRKLSRKEYQAD